MKKNNREYLLQEGDAAQHRLKEQSDFMRACLKNAFDIAGRLKKLNGLMVVDFGCGPADIHDDVMSFIGDSGIYIGIDASKEQIDVAKKQHPTTQYIVGDFSTPKALDCISKADIVYMRYVVMHQKEQATFIKNIYDAMKPDAILIMQEPESCPAHRKLMEDKYPGSNILSDFKTTIGERRRLNYNFAQVLKETFSKLGPNNLISTTQDIILPMTQAKPYLEKIVKEVASIGISTGLLSQKEVDTYLAAIAQLPTGKNDCWYLDKIHTVVGQKHF